MLPHHTPWTGRIFGRHYNFPHQLPSSPLSLSPFLDATRPNDRRGPKVPNHPGPNGPVDRLGHGCRGRYAAVRAGDSEARSTSRRALSCSRPDISPAAAPHSSAGLMSGHRSRSHLGFATEPPTRIRHRASDSDSPQSLRLGFATEPPTRIRPRRTRGAHVPTVLSGGAGRPSRFLFSPGAPGLTERRAQRAQRRGPKWAVSDPRGPTVLSGAGRRRVAVGRRPSPG